MTEEAAKPEAEAPLSRKQKALAAVRAKYQDKSPIDGKVIGWNQGGFHVSVEGIAAFCPRSQMELSNPRKPESYLDRTFSFTVLDMDENGRKIVVSRRQTLENERSSIKEELEEKLRSGAVLSGSVDSLSSFGAFVDLGGGIRGLIHLSEMSLQRIERPEEVVEVGQQIEVKILKIEKGGERISLSLRALEPDPWQEIGDRYKRGTAIKGTVVRKTDFGVFVELEDGIEGLLHSSQLAIGTSLSDNSLEAGKEIEGWVRELDIDRHRLSLTMREVPEGDPWEDVGRRYEEGDLKEGIVEQVSRHGFFVALEPGLTGLLPFGAVSAPAGRKRENAYRPGQKVTVSIMELNAKRRRISLGLEGARAEGSKADLVAFRKSQTGAGPGLGALAAAFEKLKQE